MNGAGSGPTVVRTSVPETTAATRYGFTLVELLITLTVTAVVLGSMVSFFASQSRGSRMADTRIEAVQRARFAGELLRREMSLAGSGIPNAQPMVVYAGPNDFVFSADLTSNTPGDRVAVYYDPSAPVTETEGADSGSITLPNGQPYPQAWYGSGGLPGPAETVRFSFVDEGGSRYALVRSVNGVTADTLLRGLMKDGTQDFFTYEAMDVNGGLRAIGSGPVWHAAAIHGSPADTAGSALADSVKLVHLRFKIAVRARHPDQVVEQPYAIGISLKNAGLIQNASCGDAPVLGVVPAAAVSVSPLQVTITWPPATDERSGERDVYQYTLYRSTVGGGTPRPIASIPPDANLATYTYIDTDVESSTTYIYLLGATDCTPTQSSLGSTGPVTIP